MNNFEYAQKIENNARKAILSDLNSDIEKKFAEKIFDELLIIEPRKDESNIITIDMSSHYPEETKGISRKLSNICLNFKEAMLLAFETTINLEAPTSAIDYVKLALNILLKTYIVSAIPIENNDCKLLIYLHNNNAYNNPIEEEKIISEIESGMIPISRDAYKLSIAKLIKIASITIIDGKVWLNEKVKLKY